MGDVTIYGPGVAGPTDLIAEAESLGGVSVNNLSQYYVNITISENIMVVGRHRSLVKAFEIAVDEARSVTNALNRRDLERNVYAER